LDWTEAEDMKMKEMLTFDYGLPAAIIIVLIAWAWFSFFTVVFFG
jgi:hypothetical protein